MGNDFNRTKIIVNGSPFVHKREGQTDESYRKAVLQFIRANLPAVAKQGDFLVGCAFTQGIFSEFLIYLTREVLLFRLDYAMNTDLLEAEMKIENGKLIILRKVGFRFNDKGKLIDRYIGIKLKVEIPLDQIPGEEELKRNPHIKGITGEAIITPTVTNRQELNNFLN